MKYTNYNLVRLFICFISCTGSFLYAQNTAPVIDPPDPVFIQEDAGAQTISLFGIGDGDADTTQAITSVTATSSNTSLIPHPTVTYTSDNATGSLDYTPVSNANGSAVITVTIKLSLSVDPLLSSA